MNEWIIVGIIALLVLVFGAKKLPELARGVGRTRSEFKRGLEDDGEPGVFIEKNVVKDNTGYTFQHDAPGFTERHYFAEDTPRGDWHFPGRIPPPPEDDD